MRAIGIDISDAYVDMVELRQRFGSIALLQYGRASLKAGAVVHGMIQDSAAVAQAIQSCIAEAKPKPTPVEHACFSVPESTVHTHTFTFPRTLKPQEIEDAIRIQFSEYFPFDIEAMDYDWHVVQKSEQTQSVCVGACEKKMINDIIATAALCGITVDSIDSESMSTARAVLPAVKKMEAYMLIDSGAPGTSLTVFDELGIQMTMSLKGGGNLVSELIAKKRKISFDDAEVYKKHIDITDQGYADIRSVVEDVFYPVCVEAKRMISFVESSSPKKIQAVYMCGGSSLLNGLDVYFEKHIERKVLRGNALQHLKHHDILKNSEEAMLYTNAIGLTLAVIEPKGHAAFNFLQKRI